MLFRSEDGRRRQDADHARRLYVPAAVAPESFGDVVTSQSGVVPQGAVFARPVPLGQAGARRASPPSGAVPARATEADVASTAGPVASVLALVLQARNSRSALRQLPRQGFSRNKRECQGLPGRSVKAGNR